MTFFEAITLGVIQGITEWLPISSDGILNLVALDVFGEEFREAFHISLWLHLGTLFSAIIYFRKDVVELTRHFFSSFRSLGRGRDAKSKLTAFLVVSTISTGIVGAPLLFLLPELRLSGSMLTFLIGVFLVFTGLVQKFVPRKKLKTFNDLSLLDGLLIGIVQGITVLPGVSRSGFTIAGLLFRKYEDTAALRLSFLMGIPVIAGGEVLFLLKEGVSFITLPFLVGGLTSFLVGLLSIGMLIKLAIRLPFWKFAVGLGVLAMLVGFFLG